MNKDHKRKISVIIPVYNTENYLEKCLNSLMCQTYRNIEVIMVNDESTDNSLEVMNHYCLRDERFHGISIKHGGLSAARNAGLEMATGDFFSFVDSDDWIERSYYETMINLIDEYDADAAYLDWMDEYSNGKSVPRGNDGKTIKIYREHEIVDEVLRHRSDIRISSGLISRRMIEGLQFESRSTSGEEFLFNFFSLLKANLVVYQNLPYYHRYFREGSLSTKKGFNPYNFGKPECALQIYEYVKGNCDEYLASALENVVIQNITLINHLLLFNVENNYKEDYKRLKNALDFADAERAKFKVSYSTPKYYVIVGMIKNVTFFYRILVLIYYRFIKRGL